MSCGRINRGSEPDCENIPDAGTRARLILMNWTDIERIYTNDDGKIIQVEMKSGKVGYEFLGFRNDVGKEEEIFKTKIKSRFRHAVNFVIYENDQPQKNNIKKITRGRFVAIVESKGKEEDSIELLGKNVGLEIVGGRIRDAYENGGLFTISLATPDNGDEFEVKLPQTLGVSYLDGLEIIEQILNPTLEMTFDVTTQFPFDSTTDYSFDEE